MIGGAIRPGLSLIATGSPRPQGAAAALQASLNYLTTSPLHGQPCEGTLAECPLTPCPTLLPEWISAISTRAGVHTSPCRLARNLPPGPPYCKPIRDTARQEAQNSEDRTRPYVSLDVVPSAGRCPGHRPRRVKPRQIDASQRSNRSSRPHLWPLVRERTCGSGSRPASRARFDLAPGTRRRFFWHFPASPSSTPNVSRARQLADQSGNLRLATCRRSTRACIRRAIRLQRRRPDDLGAGSLDRAEAADDQDTRNIVMAFEPCP